jgi:hypothetical protein
MIYKVGIEVLKISICIFIVLCLYLGVASLKMQEYNVFLALLPINVAIGWFIHHRLTHG